MTISVSGGVITYGQSSVINYSGWPSGNPAGEVEITDGTGTIIVSGTVSASGGGAGTVTFTMPQLPLGGGMDGVKIDSGRTVRLR